MRRGAVDPEAQIDALIAKRATQIPADGEREELWAESVLRYHRERTVDFTQAWIHYHRRLHRTHQGLADEHYDCAVFLEGLLVERSA